MKKRLFSLVLLAVVILVMSSCGGASGAQTYAGFYSAIIPEGFTANEEETEFTRESSVYAGDEEIIKVYVSYGDAEEAITSSVEYWAGGEDAHQRMEDVTYGDITWLVETFTWNDGAPSCTFYTNTEDGHYIEVNCFLLAHDSEEVVAMMESFTFEEGASDKYDEFMNALYGE